MKWLIGIAVLVVLGIVLLISPPWETTGQFTRTTDLPPKVFANLPPLPGDFSRVLGDLYTGEVQMGKIGEEYYLQPEFYPTFADTIEVMQFPRQHWGVLGFGVFPSTVKVTSSGEPFSVATIFHTSWLVETYQGMRLEVVMDAEKDRFFDVSLNPDIILLEPAYPVFGKDWAQKILITVTPHQPPPGTYLIGIAPTSPPGEFSQKWSSQYEKYTEGGGVFGVGRPLFQIILDIT